MTDKHLAAPTRRRLLLTALTGVLPMGFTSGNALAHGHHADNAHAITPASTDTLTVVGHWELTGLEPPWKLLGQCRHGEFFLDAPAPDQTVLCTEQVERDGNVRSCHRAARGKAFLL